jgi:hypothetical protein
MITLAIGAIINALFTTIVQLLVRLFRTVAGTTIWDDVTSRVATFAASEGVGVGLGLFDAFVGIDFVGWATGLAITIIVTVKITRLIMGIFSKA